MQNENMDQKHRLIANYLKTKKRGKLLDAGGGEGDLYSLLKNRFDVTVCDIEQSYPRNNPIDKVDLNNNLPYRANSFDYVTCVEVIEHIENPHHLIREFKKILKPHGILIITTPNISNTFSRLKFLVTGVFFCFSEAERKSKHGHINPIPYWELKDILDKNNFEIIEVKAAEYLKLSGVASITNLVKRVISYMVYIILYPVLTPKNKELLKGDNIIVIAKSLK